MEQQNYKLRIACLNLGFSVMSNEVSGSESIFVKKCQSEYPKNKGWSNSIKKISYCSFNATQFLSDYDLFAVQEVNVKYKDVFFETIKSQRMDKNFEFLFSKYHSQTNIAIGYNSDVMGSAIELTHDMKLSSKTDSRTIQIVWFEKHKLLFINLHAPQNINLKRVIEETCRNVKLTRNPDRIIMCGDFNDFGGKLIKESINVFNKELKIPYDNAIPKTCCTDTGYVYPGDYFLDSKYYRKNIYFGLPIDYDRDNNLLSDHDPIVFIEF